MTQGYDWQGVVGNSWASEWQRTDRSLEALNTALVERVAEQAPAAARILDIGCGAGATSFALAQRMPQADLLGIDLSESLVAAAEARNRLANVRFERQDATRWRGGDWKPEQLVSRHGVMFFDDPVSAFSHLGNQAAPGARLVFSCFRAREVNDWVGAIMSQLPVSPVQGDPHVPGPFAFADPERVGRILAQAGWQATEPEALDFGYVAGAGSDPVEDALAFFQRIGPAAPILRELDASAKAEALDRLRQVFCNRLEGGTVSFKAAAWIWSAHV